MHRKFVNYVVNIFKHEENAIGLALGGSWISKEIDEFSDLDFILVTASPVAPDKNKMMKYAEKFGNLLTAFTGEHVGEKRLLICLYDNPLIHVDLKFITPNEFYERVENPEILWEKDNILSQIIGSTEFKFPYPDYQWIEDRFWVWIHYVATKIGRGELFEVLDGINFLRTNVIASLLQIKNGNLPKGYRKAEKQIVKEDLQKLENTVAKYDRAELIFALNEIIKLYKKLRESIFPSNILYQNKTEKRTLEYLSEIIKR